MVRKLLFVLPSFQIGGTTVSTINTISVLDKDKYGITVWPLCSEGILGWMYEGIDLLPSCFTAQALAFESWRSGKTWPKRIAAAIVRFCAKRPTVRRWLIRNAVKKSVGKRCFDTVIACQENLASEFASFIPADNSVAWVRCDYKRYLGTKTKTESFYSLYRHIVCVADRAQEVFVNIYPQYKDKTYCIYNPQDSNLILSQATVDDHDPRLRTDKTVILSMGRLSSVKRFTQIPAIARQLREKGQDFYWYIVGDGAEKQAIADAISQNGVDDCVLMLGAKSNPHFYISHADLFVCLSVSEACPRVINEAKILGTPVVSTDFPTVYEFLEDGVDGRIASLESIPQAILEMLTDTSLYTRIKETISGFKFDNSHLIMQLEAIL